MTKLSCALCVELCQARGHIVDALARLNGAVHVLNLRVGSPPRTAVQFLGRMSQHFPVCLAEFFAIKAMALLAVGIVVYLYWTGFQEKRAQRRDRKWLENKRRELKAKAGNKSEGE
jgi:hypothetical protein